MFKKVKKFVSEHKVECRLVGLCGILGGACCVVGSLYGYSTGIEVGTVAERAKWNKALSDALPKIVDQMGFNGFVAAMNAYEDREPELWNKMVDVLEQKHLDVSLYFYELPDVKKYLDIAGAMGGVKKA